MDYERSINIICEGCNIKAIYKDDAGLLYLAKEVDGEIELEETIIEKLIPWIMDETEKALQPLFRESTFLTIATGYIFGIITGFTWCFGLNITWKIGVLYGLILPE